MSVKQLVENAMKKDPVGLNENFKKELKSRVAALLEQKMQDYDKNKEDDEEDDEDDDEDDKNLDEASSKSLGDFKKLLGIKKDPQKGERLDLDGYPFEFDDYDEEGSLFFTAVDRDAATNLVKTFRSKGFKATRSSNKEFEVELDSLDEMKKVNSEVETVANEALKIMNKEGNENLDLNDSISRVLNSGSYIHETSSKKRKLHKKVVEYIQSMN